jgi:hypothetical protein
MINPANNVRKAFYTLLNGNISYGADVVPVYEGEGEANIPYQILIGNQSYTEEGTKHSFAGRFSQELEIVTEMKGKSVTKHADEIANEVLALVIPTPRTTGLNVAEFQVIGIRKNLRSVLREEAGNGNKIVRRIIEFNFLINQINL